MDLHTTRLKLTGLVGPSRLWDAARDQLLHLIVGDAVEIDLGLFESETTPVASVSNIELITWQVYENALAETLLLPAVTTDTITTVTLSNWNAGTHQSATLALADTDTNLEITTGSRQAWAVIYATLTGGNRRVLGAGPIILQRSNAGGTGPAETPDELYPTNAEMAAFLAGVVKFNEAQSLSGGEKTQALTNIGAAPQSQVDQISGAVDTVASDLTQEITDRENGDTATLAAAESSAESYADAGDVATLATANGYTDDAITDLINGSPAALDTLLELAGALGDDPNFAATVAGQIGDNADAIEAEETARIAGDLALNDDIEAEETARIAADAVLQTAIGDEETARIAADELLLSKAGIAVENFIGGWIHNPNGYGGCMNWQSLGAGTQGLWSNASILPNYPGAPTLYANNGSFFSCVAAAASGSSMVGVIFDFTFRTDFAGATTANRYFAGWRNALSTTADTGSRGLFWEAGDTNWSLLHTTSAGVQTKVDTGVPYAANTILRVIVTVVSATETTMELRRDGFSPVIVTATTGFSMSGVLGVGFALWSTAANNRFINPCRAVLRWPIPTL